MVVHTFDALKSKNFSIYMAGQSVALTGMWVQACYIMACLSHY